jgi:hypothetical protein
MTTASHDQLGSRCKAHIDQATRTAQCDRSAQDRCCGAASPNRTFVTRPAKLTRKSLQYRTLRTLTVRLVAAKAVAVIGPIPGMVASKRQIELVLWISANRMSIPSICCFSASSCPTRASKAKQASSGRSSRISSSFATRASTRCLPCGTITPYSAKCARNAQAAIVLCRTRSPRALCSIRNA